MKKRKLFAAHRRRKTGMILAAAFFTLSSVLTGCGASGKSDAYREMDILSETAAAPEMGYEMPEMVWKAEAQDMSANGFDSGLEQEQPGEAAGGTSPQQPSVQTGRKLIRNVSMDVETDTFDELLASVNARISELGGYTERSETSGASLNHRGEPSPKYASITARIPSDQLDTFIYSMEQGGNVVRKSETTTDVTLQYSDLESRKKTLEMEQERIWALLEKADTLEAVITLEQRLSEIRYELESMESRLRLYDNQVEYSTIEIYISEVKEYTPAQPVSTGERIKNGFLRNLSMMGKVGSEFVIGLLVSIPIWLPLILLVFVVLLILHAARILKFRKKEKIKKEETKTEEIVKEDDKKQ